jgi:hypothetical protein
MAASRSCRCWWCRIAVEVDVEAPKLEVEPHVSRPVAVLALLASKDGQLDGFGKEILELGVLLSHGS